VAMTSDDADIKDELVGDRWLNVLVTENDEYYGCLGQRLESREYVCIGVTKEAVYESGWPLPLLFAFALNGTLYMRGLEREYLKNQGALDRLREQGVLSDSDANRINAHLESARGKLH